MDTISPVFRGGNGRSEELIELTRMTQLLSGRAGTQIWPVWLWSAGSCPRHTAPRALAPHLLPTGPPCCLGLSLCVSESTTERTRGLAETDSTAPAPTCRYPNRQGTPSKVEHPGQLRSQFWAPGDKPHLLDESLTLSTQPPANDN